MESDDDYQSFSPPSEPSPSLHLRKLKRLKKKSIKVSADPPPAKSTDDDLISLPAVDFAKLEALESSKNLGSDDSEEQLESQSPSDSIHIENELSSGLGGLNFDEGRRETKRALEFDDDVADEFGGEKEDLDGNTADLRIEKVGKKRSGEGISNEEKEKKKRFKSILALPPVDFAKLEALESSKTLGFDESNEPFQSESPSEGSNDENKSNSEGVHEDPRQTRRVLEFNEAADEFGGERVDNIEENEEKTEELRANNSEKKRITEGGLNEKKKKVKSVSAETKQNLSKKRREEKERRSQLQQLHVESQRLLRETRGAGFKPVPVVQKPISSILEKIRQRKLEVSKKISHLNSSVSIAESNEPLREVMMDVDSEKVSTQGGTIDKKLADSVQVEANTVANPEDLDSSLDASMDEIKESGTQSSHENVKSQMALDEEATPAFRAPVDDTQDLFGDSQTSDIKDDQPKDQCSSPLEEILAPSLLTMNLKFDSVPPDDDSFSDEEENDKENLDPLMHKPGDECSSPKGDPVKAFVDDEAEEEDDSDNDLFRFQENEEDEGNEDSEEINDLIVTGYEEKPIDNEKRNELHQKWLEQQDAAGTDNLMQRLKCGPKVRDTTLLDVEDESDEDEEDFSDDEKDVVPAKTARINTRKAKQMITQMFADKDDAFLSSDDEETEKRLVKQRVLDKAGDQVTLVSPAEDESSREVFCLIKKLNNAPVTKKKAKASTFFGTLLTGGNSNCSSKSSFLGRVSSHSLPSSNKQKSSMVRSFIFGRDDSNSRSSVSISEDSSDAVSRENRPTRCVTAKFSGSQAKSMTQSTKIVAETDSGTSLFEILKHSSMQSNSCNQDTMVGLTQTVFSAFKIPKKPIKIEGRTKY